MLQTPKDRVTELQKSLRDGFFQQDRFARMTVELLKLSIEELQVSLVTAEGEDIPRQQGAARYMTRLLRELTTQPPTISGDPNGNPSR